MYTVELSKIQDLNKIYEMYVDAMATEGCTWDETYPTIELIESDILRKDSIVVKVEDTGEIIAALSIDNDKIVEELNCWSKELEPSKEIARVVVKEEFQGQGITKLLIDEVIKVLSQRGYKGIHYLVSPYNVRAIRAYEKLKFTKCGEESLYGYEWYCFEKSI